MYTPEKYILNKFDVFTTIFTTPVDIILAQKIYAIFNRKALKGRDFFDVVFLLGKCDPNYDYLTLKLDIKDKNELRDKLLEKIDGLDFKSLSRDVRPFLMDSKDLKRVEEFENFIKMRLV